MKRRKVSKTSSNNLLKDVVFITLLAILFLVIVGKYGGYASDFITKKSCSAVDEKYVPGENPGGGLCIKNVKK